MVWLRYMSYHLEATEVDKARAVAERALTTMSSSCESFAFCSEKQENFNVWVGYLNLENMYGTPELLKKVMDRALKENKPKKVYWHMIKVYIQSGKMEEAEQLYTTMTNKLRQKRKVWKEFGEFHYKNHRPESARKILQSSLKSLDKKYHAGTISKFAQMEFEYGEPERGKTMFENLLRKKPKRTRIWSLYIDLVTKLGEIENARKMYERVGNLNLSAKKMRFFFKKYLDFEKGQRETESMAVVNCRL
ncbi:hypothetical protein FSP39_002771 [Pinctada imbricata]|uniref:Pre-mRNA-splicing factor Syf1/CRNKL1-like C-terminal HAT-repeats domain-containing protein n=1 Tax=Pinctada imbricata TaxID=66713 RepID=A0AA89C4I7_PINIB|nr:hypothetical protein FSP39_002771 [Pinctada imbricata]